MDPAIAEGIRLFNSRRFFEAHEALEALWLLERGDEKLFLHGLIQVAAAFHHYQRENWEGFRSLLVKGSTKLAQFSETRGGDIDIPDFLKQIQPWLAASEASGLSSTLPLPVIRTLGGRSIS